MEVIRNSEIESGLEGPGFARVYLCGDLKMSNGVRHIQTDGYEIGISQYREFTFEKPHIHSFNHEYNFVLEGQIKVLLLRTGQEILLKKGDLFLIEPNEPYVGKSLPGTKTLFSKTPGGNDKVLVPMTPAIESWGASWDAVYEETAL